MSDISAPGGVKNGSAENKGNTNFQRGSGQGRRKGRPFLKGRQIDPTALAEVKNTLGHRPRKRDLLIEHLHLFQDKFGYLSLAHLAALAHEMKMAMAEVYEVATFYAHFDVVRENECPPPAITLRVCDSLTCSMFGAERILSELNASLDNNFRVVRAPCIGACDKAPVAAVGHNLIENVSSEKLIANAKAALSNELPHREINPIRLDEYLELGGYKLLKECLSGQITQQGLIAELGKSALRGLGGAGFPTSKKWDLVRANNGRKALAVNGDEGEPGTFKDRLYLENDPHRTLEGM